jgi:outer membrane biosynthesis protein TonB
LFWGADALYPLQKIEKKTRKEKCFFLWGRPEKGGGPKKGSPTKRKNAKTHKRKNAKTQKQKNQKQKNAKTKKTKKQKNQKPKTKNQKPKHFFFLYAGQGGVCKRGVRIWCTLLLEAPLCFWKRKAHECEEEEEEEEEEADADADADGVG